METPKVLNSAPNIISFFVGMSVVISVVYEFAFFKTFGVSLSHLPSSISDHLKSSIDIYALAMFLSVQLIIGLVWIVVLENNEYKKESHLGKRESKIKIWIWIFFSSALYFWVSAQHPVESKFFLIRYLSLCSTILTLFYLYKYELWAVFGRANSLVILALILSVVGIFLLGNYDAIRIKEGKGTRIEYAKSTSHDDLYMVKSFSSHFVFWDRNKSQLIFVKVDNVENLRLIDK
jgi:hypothetical protein